MARRTVRRNPVIQRRAPHPKEKQGTEFREDDGRGWADAVSELVERAGWMAEAPILVEASAGIEGTSSDDESAAGEVTLYCAQQNAFPELKPSEDEMDTVEKRGEWAKQHASIIVRGDVEDVPEVLRWLLGETSFQGVRLGTTAFWHGTPVLLKNREYPDGVWRTLNTVLFNDGEMNVFEKIVKAAQWVREYNETNEDSVSDLPTSYFAESKTTVATRILDGNAFKINTHGDGWAPGQVSPARAKLQLLYEECQKQDEEDFFATNKTEKYTKILRKTVNEAVKYSDIWCLSDPNDKKRPDPEKDYVFMSYQTEDLVHDQLPDDVMEEIDLLPEEQRQRVAVALDRVDIDWDQANEIRVGEVNGHWLFSFDVDTLTEEIESEFPEEDEAEDEDV